MFTTITNNAKIDRIYACNKQAKLKMLEMNTNK